MQRTHYNSSFSKRLFPITLVSDNVSNALNIGSLFRVADAFGIEKFIICGQHISIDRKVAKTSRATDKAVNFEIKPNALEAVKKLKKVNHQIVALEISSSSKPLHRSNFDIKTPIALVVGDENFGVSNDILQLADNVIHIEMFGQNSSMNVVQAANIALYEITRQFL